MNIREVKRRAKKVKALILDVDGVLTDGQLIFTDKTQEYRAFNVYDGFGMVILNRAGIIAAIITAKVSKSLLLRARQMGVAKVYQNCSDKTKPYGKVLSEFKLKDEEVCFVGDDIIDLPVLRRVGLAVSVPNAVDEVKKAAHYITKRPGGKGAVREVVELILKSKGQYENIIGSFG
jgi:3-deoxy-D-manno-octulosonate 8-phosphate phosphatase (KDO 8-P phosphatase)